NMGMAEFSNIGRGGRDNKNTPLLSGMFDRNSVLRFLNWIKSSLEDGRKRQHSLQTIVNAIFYVTKTVALLLLNFYC
ncbi:MAG: hypothetical protein ACR2N3_00650, partial [Pyrinomonadaceae bacterium]